MQSKPTFFSLHSSWKLKLVLNDANASSDLLHFPGQSLQGYIKLLFLCMMKLAKKSWSCPGNCQVPTNFLKNRWIWHWTTSQASMLFHNLWNLKYCGPILVHGHGQDQCKLVWVIQPVYSLGPISAFLYGLNSLHCGIFHILFSVHPPYICTKSDTSLFCSLRAALLLNCCTATFKLTLRYCCNLHSDWWFSLSWRLWWLQR